LCGRQSCLQAAFQAAVSDTRLNFSGFRTALSPDETEEKASDARLDKLKHVPPELASCCFPKRRYAILPVGNPMKEKSDVPQGTLALMVLKTLDVLGPLHGYGIARRIEQISGDLLTLNQGTLYPVLLRLEQEGSIASEWGASENNRKARFYKLTRDGRKQLQAETRDWEQTAAIIARFFAAKAEDLK
jgi:transcriptional regulator